MRLVSYNPLRTLGIPGVRHLKPDGFPAHAAELADADGVLFPETWQVNALQYALGKRVFPSFPTYHLGASKIEMTRAFQALVPAHVPETVIASANDAGIARVLETLMFPLVVKEPRESMGRGVHRLETERELRVFAAGRDALYAQELLPIDRDLRVVWVGDRVLAAYWRIGGDGFHTNVARGGAIDFDGVPPQALELVARVATALGVDHAGFDVALVGGRPYLFEFNLLFGNEALNERGIDTAPAIVDYLERRWH